MVKKTNPNKMSVRAITVLLTAVITMIGCMPAFAFAAEEGEGGRQGKTRMHQKHSTGLQPLSEKDKKWLDKNSHKISDVKLNKIGLDRINSTRKSQGLTSLNGAVPAELGKDVVLDGVSKAQFNTESYAMAAEAGTLPGKIDNSIDPRTAKYFPPIELQKGESCSSFSLTYYIMTYMNAMSRDWTVSNGDPSKIFSTKWTYNMISAGKEGGSSLVAPYTVLMENGCATLSEFPYNDNNPNDLKELCGEPNVWKNAINYKIDHLGEISNPEAPEGFDLLKKLLVNGYLLHFSTDAELKDDSAYTKKLDGNQNLIESCLTKFDKKAVMGHAMTIVGYDDSIWFDANGDNIPQTNEYGAIKVANSWGPNWSNGKNGFFWVSYDLIKYKGFFKNEGVLWLEVKPFYKPRLLAKFTLRTRDRQNIKIELGYSNTSSTTPAKKIAFETFTPQLVEDYQPITFNGTQSEGIGTFYFDYTDLISGDNLSSATPYRWYLNVTANPDNIVSVKDFCLVDANTGHVTEVSTEEQTSIGDFGSTIKWYKDLPLNSVSPSPLPATVPGMPINFNGKTNCNSIDLAWEPAPSPNAQALYYKLEIDGDSKNTMHIFDTKISFNYPSKASHRYRVAAVNEKGVGAYTNLLEVSTLDAGMFSKNSLGIPREGLGTAQLNRKIYAAGGYGSSGYLKNLDVFSPSNNVWTPLENMSEAKSNLSVVAADNKIFALGGYDGSKYLRTMEIYNPNSASTYKWSVSDKPLPNARSSAAAVEVDNKIYVIGGQNSNGALNSIDVYDIEKSSWSTISSALKTPRYNFGVAAVNGKIYIFGGTTVDSTTPTPITRDINSIEVFDTTKGTSTLLSCTLGSAKAGLTASALNNKIYIAGGTNSSTIDEFDPVSCTMVRKSSFPSARKGLSSAVMVDKIFFIGGSNGSTFINECFQYEPLAGCMSYKASKPSGRITSDAVLYNGKIYTAGESGQIANIFDVYDPVKGTWSTPNIPPMREERKMYGMVSANGYIYAIGGKDANGNKKTIERFNGTAWEPAGTLNYAHAGAVCVVLKDKIYVIGGNAITMSYIEEYDIKSSVVTKVFNNSMISGHYMSAAVIGDKIYVSNGGTITEFDPVADKLTDVYSSTYARNGKSKIAALGDLIYIFGGEDTTASIKAKNISQIEIYSPFDKSSKVDSGAAYNGYLSFACLPYKGSIYLFGESYSYPNQTGSADHYNNERVFPANTLEYTPNAYSPAGLKAVISGNSVNLTWDTALNASRYYIEVDGSPVELFYPTYTYPAVKNTSRLYSYRVKALTTSGSSVWSRKVKGKYMIYGDINMDNSVTAADDSLLGQYLGGSITLSYEQLAAADVNNDGAVTGADRTLLSNHVKGVVTAPIGDMKLAVYGDTDGNGMINHEDYDLLYKFLMEMTNLTGYQKMCADVDGNGMLDSDDYAYLRQYLLNLITELPVR